MTEEEEEQRATAQQLFHFAQSLAESKITTKLFLAVLSDASFVRPQSSVYNWVRVHRVHHKFAETVKDPLNFKRGFFFAHVGWYCLSFHPECEKEMQRIDMNDIKADKDVMFQYQ